MTGRGAAPVRGALCSAPFEPRRWWWGGVTAGVGSAVRLVSASAATTGRSACTSAVHDGHSATSAAIRSSSCGLELAEQVGAELLGGHLALVLHRSHPISSSATRSARRP